MSLIRKEPQKVKIPLSYIEKTNAKGFVRVIVLEEKDALKKLEDPEKKKEIQILNTEWKTLNWKEQTEITKQATNHGAMPDGSDTYFDYYKYRDLRLKRCLINWDLKDETNNPVPVSSQNVDLLPPDVVATLINKFDEITSISPEEEKK
jgi:hypothetical protein